MAAMLAGYYTTCDKIPTLPMVPYFWNTRYINPSPILKVMLGMAEHTVTYTPVPWQQPLNKQREDSHCLEIAS
jgi:hypothetical protein